jgi:cytochrome c oxidase subunit 3
MLFGALFSSYILLRVGAYPGVWPHGILNVPVGTVNTLVLICSSVTVVLSWTALKMNNFAKYRRIQTLINPLRPGLPASRVTSTTISSPTTRS